MPPRSKNRLAQLDILRGAAILLVLGRHLSPDPSAFPVGLKSILRLWQSGGWVGVDLFFVLSGFLVSNLLFREFQQTGAVKVRRFLLRRSLKIYPAFYIFLAISFVWFAVLHQPKSLSDELGELLFMQNYVGAMWVHTWSLAVEEHFYLILAFLASALSVRFRSFRLIPAIYVWVAIVTLSARIITTMVRPFSYTLHQFPTHLRIDTLFTGVVVSYFINFRRDWLYRNLHTWRWPIWSLSLAVLFPIFFFESSARNPVIHTVGFTIIALTFGANLPLLLEVREPRQALLKMLWNAGASIGRHSYSIYLWHLMMLGAAGTILARLVPAWPRQMTLLSPGQSCLMLLTYLTLAIVGGIGAGVTVETPILRLRDHWFPSPSVPTRVERQVLPPPIRHDSLSSPEFVIAASTEA